MLTNFLDHFVFYNALNHVIVSPDKTILYSLLHFDTMCPTRALSPVLVNQALVITWYHVCYWPVISGYAMVQIA